MTVLDRGLACGCDARTDGLASIDDALARIAAIRAAGGTERVWLGRALGRVLASDLRAAADLPPFTAAAMDGYALRHGDVAGAGPWELPVAAHVAAGAPAPALAPGHAARVTTGAPLPEGADTVVMQEAVTRRGDTIGLRHRPSAGENVRLRGEECAAGATGLRAGTRLTARALAAAAACGHDMVRVRRRTRVALLVTGNEVAPGAAASGGAAIFDVNTLALGAAMDRPDLDLVAVEHVADDPGQTVRALRRLSAGADLVVTTGGLSVGDGDHVRPAIRRLGGAFLFEGVAMKPGKPVAAARLGDALWLGLPGNPLAALVGWRLFGEAALDALAARPHATRRRTVVLDEPVRHKPGRCELRPARIAGLDGLGREVVRPEPATLSARVVGLAGLDGLVVIPDEAAALPAGALADFLPFD